MVPAEDLEKSGEGDALIETVRQITEVWAATLRKLRRLHREFGVGMGHHCTKSEREPEGALCRFLFGVSRPTTVPGMHSVCECCVSRKKINPAWTISVQALLYNVTSLIVPLESSGMVQVTLLS